MMAIMESSRSFILTLNGGSPSIKFALYEIKRSLKQFFYSEIKSIGTENPKLSSTTPFGNT